jgi:biotin transport system substrate-specific component
MWSAALMGVAGSAVVYAAGLVWMVPWLGLSLGEGLAAGVLPFLVGDALKIAVVAALMPAAWGWRGRRR